MALAGWRLGALVMCVVAPRSALAQLVPTPTSACTGHTSGVWVAVAGKDRYALGQARRIPPGELVTLRGYPRPPQLPVVTLRLVDETAPTNLAVSLEGECGWSAPLPSLRPNAKAEIKVTAFAELSQDEKGTVRNVFVAMLRRFAEGLSTAAIKTNVSPEEYTRSAQEYLTRYFPADSTLRGFVLIPAARQSVAPLGQQLVTLMAESDSFAIASVQDKYRNHLLGLKDVLLKRAVIDTITEERRRRVVALVEAVGSDFFELQGAPIRRRRVASLMMHNVLPLRQESATALRSLVLGAVADTLTRRQMEGSIDTLSLDLEAHLQGLFAAMYAATESSYQLTTVSGPFLLGDLLRYGTVDFLTGQVWDRGNGGSHNRGFLTFSFFPTGPQSRTPESLADDPTESGRYALSVGYSVTGGKKEEDEEPEDFFLAGLTVRANRYVSATFGFVSPQNGGRLRCCFAGVAGDVTAIPFLKDLFAVNPNAGK